MIRVARSVLTHISSIYHLLTETLLDLLKLYSVLCVVYEGYGRVLTFLDQNCLAPLVTTNNDFVENSGNFFHSLLSEIILFRLISASMMLNHIFRIVDSSEILEVDSDPFAKTDFFFL